MLYTVQAGRGRAAPATHHGEEFVYVLEGQVRMTLAGRSYDLKAGDSFSFHSSEPHSWHNSGQTEAKILWIYTHMDMANPSPAE